MEVKIIWTTLPNGIKGKKSPTLVPTRIKEKMLQISVFVSPRLIPDSNDSVLGDFVNNGSWSKNWTKAIKRQRTLKVNISQSRQHISVEAPILNSLDENMWSDIFPLNTPVSGYQHKDYSSKKFRSFSIREMQNSLKRIYKEVAKISPNNLPKVLDFKQNPVLRKFLEMGEIPDKFHKLRRSIDAECKEKDESYNNECINEMEPFSTINFSNRKQSNYDAQNMQELHFLLGYRYYNRLEHDENTNRVYTLEDEITVIENDKLLSDEMKKKMIQERKRLALREAYSFEQLLATLGDYPVIMRKLGLIIDLEIPITALGRNRFSNPTISIEAPNFSSISMLHTTPKTHTVLNRKSSLFYTRTEPGPATYIKQREIDLEDPNGEFDLIQVDIDGATLKSIHTANTFIKIDLTPSSDNDTKLLYGTSDDASLPSLQSAGISLARYNRAFETQEHLKKMYDENNDLTQKKTPEFYANDLVRGYRVDVQIEGEDKWYSLCQRDGSYQIKDGSSFVYQDEGYVKTAALSTVDENSYYLHENMFRWDGWSLCVERPGKLIYDEVDEENGIKPKEIDANLKDHAPLEVKFSVPKGSLPKLRFGQTYRFRVRIVDIAGNSQPLDSVCDSSLIEKYKRFEPVSPPSLTFLEEPSEGESLEHMVIRSNFDEASEETNTRHLFPPKTSQLMAETHGKFDEYMSLQQGIEEGYEIASRDANNIWDTKDHEDDEYKACEKIQVNSQNTDEDNTYIVCRDDIIYTVPYLPDVYADGVALRNVPGVTFETKITGLSVCKQFGEVVLKVPFSGDWPKIETFRIKIQEREGEIEGDSCVETFSNDGKPKWNQTSRVLTVFLPKGEIAKVKYSSYLNKESIENMGITDWTEGVSYFKNLAVCGMNWMVAPFRELILVHAVRQPLCAPKILKFNEDKERKNRGDTFAKLKGILETNAKSTEKVAILAKWNEVVDNPDISGEPQVQTFNSIAMELPIGYSQNNLIVKDDGESFGKHEFGDTKFRLVSYHLKATSRFKEYFPSIITDDDENITRDGELYEGIKIRIDKELANDYGAIIELEEGDTQDVIPIYNSARPLSPKISYMIPTFGWEGPIWSNEDGVIKVTRKRKGKGLRVYLERPWFSSGDGEMLGVVLLSDCLKFDKHNKLTYTQNIEKLNILKPYVSQWGGDPVYTSHTLDSFSLAADRFTLGKCFKRELTLEELPNEEIVDVVGHKVEYDANKQLWFSDIVIEPGNAYNPFVRLGLTRYQPNSIDNTHLSRVVLSDFMQLLPDRKFEVEFREISKGLKKYIHASVVFHGVSQAEMSAGNINIVISKYILDQAKIEENPHIGWMSVMSFDLVNGQGYADFEKPEISEIYKIEINEFEHIKKDSEKPRLSYVVEKSPRLVYHDDILFKTDAPFKPDI